MNNNYSRKNRRASGRLCVSSCNETGGESAYYDSDASDKIKFPLPPYRIKHSKELGRYLVAKRDILPNEVIIQDMPLAVGPTIYANYICIGCYVLLNKESITKCKGCQWSLCGLDCRGLYKKNGHTFEECSVLRNTPSGDLLYKTDDVDRKFMYDSLLPLRCLLLKELDCNSWNNLMQMEHHNDLRSANETLWKAKQEYIVDRIRDTWNISDFSEDEIHTVCGILDVNCFEVGYNGCWAQALYWKPTLISHDCQPNVSFSDHPFTYEISIKSTRPIKAGEIITLSYEYLLIGTLKRRDRLYNGKFFWCKCERCADPTELGTFMSAVNCPECEEGLILSTDPLDQDAIWNCSFCSYLLNGKDMVILLDKINEELEVIQAENIEGLTIFLDKYKDRLHKNHYIILSVKISLCQMYGETDGYLLEDLTECELKSLQNYCKDLLEVVRILELGQSWLKGTMLYKLQATMMVDATRLFTKEQIDIQELENRIKDAVELLKEAKDILGGEPEGTPEYAMAEELSQALNTICNLNSKLVVT